MVAIRIKRLPLFVISDWTSFCLGLARLFVAGVETLGLSL